MTEVQFIGLSLAIAASFVWMIGMRSRSRPVRVAGVCAFMGAWVAVRWIAIL